MINFLNEDTSQIKVGMVSLGCPKNQMDAELMLANLNVEKGIKLESDPALADVVIINTCGFIKDAKEESIEYILEFGKLKEEGRVKRIIVTGCLAERYKEELATELPECDVFLGLGANNTVVERVLEISSKDFREKQVKDFPPREHWSLDGERFQTTPHFFAYLRVGDGCDNCCTYCAIPYIRGPLRSRPLENLVKEAKGLVKDGVKEIIIVAQDTTLYGQDLYGEPKLVELLEELCKIEKLHWIRLLYCYPEHITDELIDIMAKEEKIVNYLDIPIQHSDDRIIKAMGRPGSERDLREIIRKIRDKIPDVALRTTLIVGFPGESDEQFESLCNFTSDIKFDRLGCFKYSPEEGTPAADFDDQIDEDIKQERQDIIMNQQMVIHDRLSSEKVGKTLDVLTEDYDKYAECYFGRTYADAPDIDTKVFFPKPKTAVKPGDFVKVKITDVIDWDLIGECVD